MLVVEANPRYPSTRQAVRWMHRRGRPVVGWGLGAPPLGQGQGLKSLLRGWERLSFLRSLDAVIAYSRRGADEYRALGLPAERVFCASNATAPRPPGPPPERPREYLGKPGVLFVGCLLYTSDAADDLLCVDLGGSRIIKKKKQHALGV